MFLILLYDIIIIHFQVAPPLTFFQIHLPGHTIVSIQCPGQILCDLPCPDFVSFA